MKGWHVDSATHVTIKYPAVILAYIPAYPKDDIIKLVIGRQ